MVSVLQSGTMISTQYRNIRSREFELGFDPTVWRRLEDLFASLNMPKSTCKEAALRLHLARVGMQSGQNKWFAKFRGVIPKLTQNGSDCVRT